MTPTPEMIALAERLMKKHFGTSNGLGVRIMSVAIMEVLDQTSAWLDGDDPISGDHIVSTIRNGEHLRGIFAQ